jgi:hypothetical protein
MIKIPKRKRPSTLLGLSLDGSRLEGVLLRRTNGSVVVQKTFFASLSLDPLTNDAELVGREILNHLEQAGIRERRCAVCLPLNWAVTLQTKLPDLPEADLGSFLQLEAERGFPYALDALLISESRFRLPAGEEYATQIAFPRDHVLRLEKALKAARLKPLSFSVGVAALQGADTPSAEGVLALAISDGSVALQVSCGGGIAALRTLEGVFEAEGAQTRLYADVVAREIRITLGQLPGEMRDAVRRVWVFGQGRLTEQLIDDLRLRMEPGGIEVKLKSAYAADELGVKLPADAALSPALTLAARYLAGCNPGLEFLPPKVKPWQQFTTRYSSKKLVWAGATAGSIALLISALFLYQEWQLSQLRSQWAEIAPRVNELDGLQQQIRKFRPWFDDSMRSLSILRRLTEAFPEDGVVSAKTVEIRELAAVTCSGIAHDNEALLKTLDQLRATREIADVKVDQIRGSKPLQFTFNFHWGERGSNEH